MAPPKRSGAQEVVAVGTPDVPIERRRNIALA